ncbi:myogenesis-regulating glycosidase-like isoform X2 [Phymastichus coffea]|uniref:myogenesis-regulating glycosidase-like isoform X2 n=1 Tax=Phymastichus coffea TaxID=108790 RepID=UPI00273B847F|nr:myogenesis-regulating glycosidase-like isoform X2 [Phymastichus coffea]
MLYVVCSENKTTTKTTRTFKNGNLDIEIKSNNKVNLNIRKYDGKSLEYQMYTKSSEIGDEEQLMIEIDCENLTTCIKSGETRHTWIKVERETELIQIRRVLDDANGQITDCFNLGKDTDWYGGPQCRLQHWPIQHAYYDEEAYVPTHQRHMSVTERYWLSSKGMYVFVDEHDPLFLDQNNFKDNHLCLMAKNKPPYRQRNNLTLSYDIGVFVNPMAAHKNATYRNFHKPEGLPDERMITHPIWSTWARHKLSVNESLIRSFADEIIAHGFNNSQVEIGDNWETCYGSARFDTSKFSDAKTLISDLKSKGFRVSLWIHPFINVNCEEAYNDALNNGYLVKNEQDQIHVSWWRGADAAAIDFTNPKAAEWWISRLNALRELGIDSFNFDAGETSWLPQVANLEGPQSLQPGIYVHNYTNIVASYFGNNIETRVGWRSQKLPNFIRMIDKDAKWSWSNGLPTLITTLLQMNLNGYIYVLPGIIGGYADNSLTPSELPSKNLFIRWLQATVFMPAMQYSYAPWDFDDNTINICKNYTDMHAALAPRIINYMKKSMETGEPLNAPIWWVDPVNIDAYKVNDEFLLGGEILVAPVIEENALYRDIFLPSGIWKDANTGKDYVGPMWLDNYSVPLNVLPHFYKNY